MLRFCPAGCLDQLWRALLNNSRRLRSRLKRCDSSSLSAPALLLLPVAPVLRRLSRQLNQCQPPLSPELLRVGEIEGAYARHHATPFPKCTRSPKIQRLRSPPDQPGRKRRGPSLATARPPHKQPLMHLSPPRLTLGAEESVFLVPNGPTIGPTIRPL